MIPPLLHTEGDPGAILIRAAGALREVLEAQTRLDRQPSEMALRDLVAELAAPRRRALLEAAPDAMEAAGSAVSDLQVCGYIDSSPIAQRIHDRVLCGRS